MTQRELKGSHVLMRIFIGESDKADGKPLYMVIMERARKFGLAGCTVVKGIAGFGAGSVIHMDAPFRLSGDLPIILEFVDTYEHVHKLLAEIKPLLQGALVTEEKVTVHHYKHSSKKS